MNICWFVVFFILLANVHGQYGQVHQHQQSPQFASRFLNDNYVCSIQANYGLYGQLGKNYRRTTNFCQDAFKTGSCEKCCQMAAHLRGPVLKEDQIVGFNVVLKNEPLCVCCAPNTA